MSVRKLSKLQNPNPKSKGVRKNWVHISEVTTINIGAHIKKMDVYKTVKQSIELRKDMIEEALRNETSLNKKGLLIP